MSTHVKSFALVNDQFSETVITIVQSAGKLAMQTAKMYPGQFQIKADGSRVTSVDLRVNNFLLKQLGVAFPDIGFLSEETGPANRQDMRWIIDPIDDTENLIRRLPGWNIMIALEVDGVIEFSICYCPMTKRVLMAKRGHGIFVSNCLHPRVSTIHEFNRAHFSIAAPSSMLRKYQTAGLKVFQAARKNSHFGSFENFHFLVTGQVDAVICGGGAIWDIAAPSLIITEAGGRFSDFAGNTKIDSGNVIYSNGFLHDKILALFRE